MPRFSFDYDPFGSRATDPTAIGPTDLALARPDPSPRIGTRARIRPEHRQPLDAEDAKSLSGDLLAKGAGALQTGLYALDTPGAYLRGVLAGKAGSRVSGRSLTDQFGLTSRSNRGWGHWGIGLAADMATDPLSYLTLGPRHALNATGRTLAGIGATKGFSREALLQGYHALEPELLAAGRTTSQVAHLRDAGQRIATPEAVAAVAAGGGTLRAGQPLAGLAGVGIPFRSPSAVFGTGLGAQRIARGLDRAGGFLKYGNPIGRAFNAKFDANVNEAVGRMTQEAWARHGTPARQAAQAEARREVFDMTSALDPAIRAGTVPEASILSAARRGAEGVAHPAAADPAAVAAGNAAGLVAGAQRDRTLAEARRLGLPLDDAADEYARYMHRQGVDIDRALSGARPGQGPQRRGVNNFPVVTGSNVHREETYRGIPGGSEQINDWVRQHAGNAADAAMIRSLKKDMVGQLKLAGTPITRPVGKQLDEKAAAMAGRLASLDPRFASEGVPLFSPNIVGDLARRGDQHAITSASAHAALGAIGDNARPIASLGADHVTVPELLKALGLRTTRADAKAGTPMQGALVEAYRRLAKAGAGPVDPFLTGKLKAMRTAAARYGLTGKQADELTAAYRGWTRPQVVDGEVGLLDNLTNTFKNLAYPLWLPSHVRNASSATITNTIQGPAAGAHAAQVALMRDTATADQLRRFLPDLPAGISDDAARSLARREMFAHAKIFSGHNGVTDQAGNIAKLNGSAPGRITPEVPGTGRAGPTGSLAGDIGHLIFKEGLGDQAVAIGHKLAHPIAGANPLQMSGVWGGTKDFPALAAGRIGGTNIEDFFRGAMYLSERAKGAAPDIAGSTVNRLHFDYDALAPFEKKWMRRLVPFYTYARKNLPVQLSHAIHNPVVASTQLRLLGAGRKEGAYVPKYLASTGAVPIGDEEGGRQRYISSFGTPIEEALERVKFKGGLPDLGGSALALAGNMNPLLKAPLERLFDTQFHTGRKLSDLKAQQSVSALTRWLGEDNPQLLAQLVANSPATRFFSAADKLIDERKPAWAKAANLLSGVKVTDVDSEKQRAVEARDARNEALAGQPHVARYTSFYVRPEDVASLTPEEVRLLRLMQSQEQAARQATELRRAGGVGARIGIRPGS